MMRKAVIVTLRFVIEVTTVPILFVLALIASLSHKRIDIGLGPEPLINNVYHKKSLEIYGFSAETFVTSTFFITQDFDKIFVMPLRSFIAFAYAIFNYRCLFIYFNGGPLRRFPFLKRVEPLLLKIARVKIVVMPYGSDVQYMQFSKNLYFKHCYSKDYPHFLKYNASILGNIHRWTKWGDWIIAGCEWVDYMYYWDSLMISHFSIDTTYWTPSSISKERSVFRILHAPNHKNIKGTFALQKAVNKLINDGFNIELVILQGVPNNKIREEMDNVDLVADQFVIGWYAMFAIEAMSMKKPVLCYIREDLLELYIKSNLLEEGELPIIQCNILEIEEKIRWATTHIDDLRLIGERGRAFVQKHHSLESIGGKFTNYLNSIGMSFLKF